MSEFGLRRAKSNKGLLLSSLSILLLLAGIAVFSVFQYNNYASDTPSPPPAANLHTASKVIEEVCSNTDYKPACLSTLSGLVNPNASPKTELTEAAKAAVEAVSRQLKKASSHWKILKSNDTRVRGAVEDCKELFSHAKKELKATLKAVEATYEIPKKAHEVSNWLSAVMSYQQTCVEGFPKGTEERKRMEKALKASKELTSNALAIAREVVSVLRMMKGVTFRRRKMLAAVPDWVEEGGRRVLLDKAARKLWPDVIVAKDGTGNFTTITDALAAMPKKYPHERYVIYVKEGIYEEGPIVSMANVTMYGEGSRKTIVTGNKNFVDGTRTYQTATFVAVGDGFMGIGMGFRNTAGAAKQQAVALRVQSDRSIFLNCRMEGYQDTLYAQTHRQFYRSCVISGTIDFVFGDAAAVFQNCVLLVRRPLDGQHNIVTAQGRVDRQETTGFVLQACRFIPDKDLNVNKTKTYLGRPWREFSRAVIMESKIGGFVSPMGYFEWDGDFGLKTLFYGEYGNQGVGAAVKGRVKWPGVKVIAMEDAMRYTPREFIQGDQWIRVMGSPVKLGLFYQS